jgi:hypothetical protein
MKRTSLRSKCRQTLCVLAFRLPLFLKHTHTHTPNTCLWTQQDAEQDADPEEIRQKSSRSAATTPVTQNTTAATHLTTGAASVPAEVLQTALALAEYLGMAAGKRMVADMLGSQANPNQAGGHTAACDNDEVKEPSSKKRRMDGSK